MTEQMRPRGSEYTVASTRGNRQFRPGVRGTVVTVTLVAIAVSLGNWQLRRAEEKKALYASFDAASLSPAAMPVDLLEPEAAPFTPVTAYGQFDRERQVLLDAMMDGGRTGYQVLTPLLRQGLPAVLVNRGWIPAAPDRGVLPGVSVSGELRRVTGFLGHLPVPAMRLAGPAGESASWPRLALYPTREQLEQMLGYPVLDAVVLLGPEQPDGYLRNWRPQLLSPDRHLGYAMQWFAIAMALIVIYVVVNLRRPEEGNNDQ
jgi:surfeit locus 1 family protein